MQHGDKCGCPQCKELRAIITSHRGDLDKLLKEEPHNPLTCGCSACKIVVQGWLKELNGGS